MTISAKQAAWETLLEDFTGIAVTTGAVSVPPEWAPQKAIWTAWPADPDEWNGDLASPRRDVAGLVRALSQSNRVRVLVASPEAEATAQAELGGAAEIVPARYGDIWLRDTGPIFARSEHGPIALRFRTNGWGGKFDLPGDATVGDDIALLAGTPVLKFDFVLEGGAIEHDGDGTILTTRQTLLNDNRNAWTEAEAEAALARGVRRAQDRLARPRTLERPYRRPYRCHRPVCRARPRGLPVAVRRRRPQCRDPGGDRARARSRDRRARGASSK